MTASRGAHRAGQRHLDWRVSPAASVACSVSSQRPSRRLLKLAGLLQALQEYSASRTSLELPPTAWLLGRSLRISQCLVEDAAAEQRG